MSKAKEYISFYTRHDSNKLCHEEGIGDLYEPWVMPDHAEIIVREASKDLINEACLYLMRSLKDIMGLRGSYAFTKRFRETLEREI